MSANMMSPFSLIRTDAMNNGVSLDIFTFKQLLSIVLALIATEIYSVNLYIQSEYGKIRTRKKSVFGYFSRSDFVYKLFDRAEKTNRYII